MIQKDFGINSSLIYEGKMDLDERNNVINIFKNNIETFALLCSGKIAGEGLNLTEANNVIFLNEWWNPSSNNQARDRVHRIGQDKAVSIFNLRTKNTVEESLAQILDKKKSITNEVIEAMVKEL
jgi:SNF2 family DNA or RNA helicase